MPLPEPMLDDLRFQKIVDEARLRIIHYCPEWTDYNVSDPGVTLIELFAWMTEMIGYRLNRVPEKNYIKFLNMMNVQLQPANSARVELTFWLSVPLPISPDNLTLTAVVPRGTEVATRRTDQDPEIIFTTDERLVIAPPQLAHLRRDPEVNKNYLPRLNAEKFYAFGRERPQIGSTFYLGFDEASSIAGHILQLTFTCDETQATGVRREDPPLVWECSVGGADGDTWEEVVPSTRSGERDTTGGLNNPHGKIVFYLPLTMKPVMVHGKSAYWLRCRFEQRRPEQGLFTQSPRVRHVDAHTLGAATWATHAVAQPDEWLGQSNGEPGQIFHLKHSPVLPPAGDETVEVEELRHGEVVFVPWEWVADFAHSTRFDRHYTLDTSTGEIAFGPSVRQVDGTVRQYGRVPENKRALRFSSYRHGGGTDGNVPLDRLQIMKVSIPYIDRVSNLQRAEGGRDPESIEEAQMRARREMRAQQRAVTAEDFENLSKQANRAVARVRCRIPRQLGAAHSGDGVLPPGTLELLIVPGAYESLQAGDLSKLELEPHLRDTILAYLDQYRLLTTVLRAREPRYLGVQVQAQIVPVEFTSPEAVRLRVIERLKNFLTPLPLGDGEVFSRLLGHTWEGWPFGRDLYTSEVFSLVQQVPGVKHVLDVQLHSCEIVPRELRAVPSEREEKPAGPQPEGTPSATPGTREEPPVEGAPETAGAVKRLELTRVEGRVLAVPDEALLCSLDHHVEVVTR